MKYPAFDLRCAWHMWIFLLSLCTWLSKLHWKIPAGISFLFLHLASDLFFSLTVVIAQPRGRASGKFGFRILKIITCGWSCQGYAVSGHAMPWNKRNRILEHKREELTGSRRGAKAGWWWWRRWWWWWWRWWFWRTASPLPVWHFPLHTSLHPCSPTSNSFLPLSSP